MEKTLVKGLAVLEAIALSERPCGIAELAKKLGLAKSNVHRLVQTLVQRGYVRRNDDPPRYECTLRLFELGTVLAERLDIRAAAAPHLVALAEKTSESVYLSILEGREMLYIDKVESSQPIRAYARTGGRSPVHCAATGKALLAYQSEDFLESLFPLAKYTPTTITTPAAIRRELDKIRARGYAVNNGEWRATVLGIAAPIFGLSRRPVAGLSISGPIDRLKPAVVRRIAPLVMETANRISESLGLLGERHPEALGKRSPAAR
jgi:IclR family KDG regulon transcriptional repressor